MNDNVHMPRASVKSAVVKLKRKTLEDKHAPVELTTEKCASSGINDYIVKDCVSVSQEGNSIGHSSAPYFRDCVFVTLSCP